MDETMMKRLRGLRRDGVDSDTTMRQAADALEAKDREIKRLYRDTAAAIDEVAALRADAKRMKLELSRWICVWCNHITLATGDPDTDYAALQAHTLSCKDNPLVQAQAEVATLRGLLRYAQGFIPAGDKDIHSRIDAALKEKP